MTEALSQPFSQSVTFKLDKAHFQECYEQSAPPVQSKDYTKAIIFAVVGVSLFFVEAEHYYFPFFLFCLAILEVFSIKYRETWWIWRQLMSKAANGRVTIIVDEEGITTASEQVNSQINWVDVDSIEQTNRGILLKHQSGVNYISCSHLSEETINFILSQSND